MKIKNVALNSVVYFLYFLGSCLLVMLAEALFVSIVEKFVQLSYPVLTVIRIVIYTVGVPALIGFLGYFEGYREAECSVSETIAGCIPTVILHLLFAMLFKFQAFISGSVRFTAGLLHNGWKITYDSLINKTPYSLFLLTFLAYSALYVAVLTISKYVGSHKRIIDRAELRKDESSAPEYDV